MFTAITAKAVGRDASQSEREPEVIALDVSHPGAAISPTMFGVFFEDINFAADGGLSPERVKNRSFEFTEPLSGWRKPWRPHADGELIVLGEGGLNENNPHSLRLRTYSPGDRGFGVVNSGFRGMGVEAGAECTLLRADPEGREHDPGSTPGARRREGRWLAGRGGPTGRARQRRPEGREQPRTANEAGAGREHGGGLVVRLRPDPGPQVPDGAAGDGLGMGPATAARPV